MPESRHNFALAVVSVLPFVSAIFVGLRLYARYVRRIKYGWDDWLLILATLLSIGMIYPSVRNIKMRFMGYHLWEASLTTSQMDPDFDTWHSILLAISLLNIPILPLAKASIVLILLRVGKIIDAVRRYLYVVFAFNLLACLVPWCLYVFTCPPRTGDTWAPYTFGNVKCFGRDAQGKLLLFINCANLMTDILIFPIPFFIMRELMNTDKRARIAIILTFASSLCVTALSAVKIYITFRDRILRVNQPDWTYSIEFIISHGESNVGIIVACVPMLRGLVSRRFKRPDSAYVSFNRSNASRSLGPVSQPSRMASLKINNEHILESPNPNDFITSVIPEVESVGIKPNQATQQLSEDGERSSYATADPLIQRSQSTRSPPPAHVRDRLS